MSDHFTLRGPKRTTGGGPTVDRRLGPGTMLMALALSLAGCSNPASAPKGHLEVQVFDVMSRPLTGIDVILIPEQKTKVTDINGRAFFYDLPVGEHQIQVSTTGYESHQKTVIVEEEQITSVSVTLTGQPASVDACVRFNNAPKPGVTVRVKRQLDGAEVGMGVSGADGHVLIEGIAAQPVMVATDNYDNVRALPIPVELVGLQTYLVTLHMNIWATLFRGHFSFGNDDPHQAALLEWTGSTFLPVLVPAYFTGTYELLTPQTGNLVAVQYGNPGPFEMDIVFSPAYNITAYTIINVPTQNSVITSASPRDGSIFYTTQFPIILTCQYPTGGCVYNAWEVDYWWWDGSDWNWTMVQLYQLSSPITQWSWNGSIAATSTLSGHALPASIQGEYYSWLLAAGYSNGMLGVTPDYLILLQTPPAAGARTVTAGRIGAAQRAALARRMEETKSERAAAGVARTRSVLPPLP
jgi:hypothetical protein